MECYSVAKNPKMMTFADKWMGVEIIIQGAVTQTQKCKCHVWMIAVNL